MFPTVWVAMLGVLFSFSGLFGSVVLLGLLCWLGHSVGVATLGVSYYLGVLLFGLLR